MNPGKPPEGRSQTGPDRIEFWTKGQTMQRHFLALSFGIGAMILATGHAFAQQRQCADRALVLKRLAEAYGESRQSIGLAANNAVVEMFASAETGTWTITLTSPAGMTCLVASGQAYEATLGDLLPTGAPA